VVEKVLERGKGRRVSWRSSVVRRFVTEIRRLMVCIVTAVGMVLMEE
jgi:hypothetical protein